MFTIASLIFTLISVLNAQDEHILGITNGTFTEPHEVPYQVFIETDCNMGIRWCSGTLITNQYVLTSGFCVDEAETVLARLGVYNRGIYEDTQVNITGIEWIQHPGFNYTTHENDIGLIKLEYPVELTEYIQLAPIVSKNDASKDYKDEIARFTGWGLQEYFQKSSLLLLAVYTPIISNDECLSSFDFIQDTHICTSGEHYVGYCLGDQGGPLVVDGVQIGIIAGGDKVCQWDGGVWPTIHMRIGSYLDWIQENSDYIIH